MQPIEVADARSSLCNTRRTTLTKEQAVEIFNLQSRTKSEKRICAKIAKQYHVSSKTIRDIWTGRTWFRATCHADADFNGRLQKQPGRPKDSKDKKPRRKSNQSKKPANGLGLSSQIKSEAQVLNHLSQNFGVRLEEHAFIPVPRLFQDKETEQEQTQFGCTQASYERFHTAPKVSHASPSKPANSFVSDFTTFAGCCPGPAPATACIDEAIHLLGKDRNTATRIPGGPGPVPTSAAAADPFHNDWPYWPAPGNGCETAPCISAAGPAAQATRAAAAPRQAHDEARDLSARLDLADWWGSRISPRRDVRMIGPEDQVGQLGKDHSDSRRPGP